MNEKNEKQTLRAGWMYETTVGQKVLILWCLRQVDNKQIDDQFLGIYINARRLSIDLGWWNKDGLADTQVLSHPKTINPKYNLKVEGGKIWQPEVNAWK